VKRVLYQLGVALRMSIPAFSESAPSNTAMQTAPPFQNLATTPARKMVD
jgi:hypothetical protein